MFLLALVCLVVLVLGAALLFRRARNRRRIQLTPDHHEVLQAAAHGDNQLARLTDPHWSPVIHQLIAVGLVMLDEDEYETYSVDITSAGIDYVTREGLC